MDRLNGTGTEEERPPRSGTPLSLSPGMLAAVAAVLLLTLAIFAVSGGFKALSGASAPARILGTPVRDRNLLFRMATALDAGGIPYEIREDSWLFAPDDGTASRARALLVQKDLLPSGTDPWALFDMERWTATDFERNVNLRRAVTAAVKRHIEALDEIERADVAIVMPERQLFSQDQRPATASVILSLASGSDFADDPGRIEGVRKLLCLAVEGLDPHNVVITDTSGRILGEPVSPLPGAKETSLLHLSPGFPDGGNPSPLQGSESVPESRLRSSLLSMLRRIYTEDRVKELSVRFLPVPESGSAVSASGNSGFPGSGPAPTMPDYKSPDKALQRSAAFPQSPQATRTCITVNIEGIWTLDRNSRNLPVRSADGGFKRTYHALTREETAQAVSLIAGFAALDPEKGDSITIHSVPSDRRAQFRIEDALISSSITRRVRTLVFILVPGILVLLTAVLFTLRTRRTRLRQQGLRAREKTHGFREAGGRRADEPFSPAILDHPLSAEASRLALKNPVSAASILRSWVSDRNEA